MKVEKKETLSPNKNQLMKTRRRYGEVGKFNASERRERPHAWHVLLYLAFCFPKDIHGQPYE